MPRLFLSVGDTSGDQHAARLVEALRARVPDLQLEGLGGPCLAAAGVTIHEDLVSQAIFGLLPALAAIPEHLGLLRRTAGLFDARRPDVVVIVDYPGWNLAVARLAHRRGIPVVYFVAPQLWAWAPWRARRFARAVDEALVIFPFEVPFFERYGLAAHHIGHPLLDGLASADMRVPDITERPRPIAVLPGSRPREVEAHMPLLAEACVTLKQRHPDATFHAAHVAPAEREHMARHAEAAGLELVFHGDDVHGVMASCHAAFVASGTATLETGLLGTPLVVLYHVPKLELFLARQLLVPPFIGKVNLVAGRELAPEIVLSEHDPGALVDAMEPLMTESAAWQAQKRGLAALAASVRGKGAVDRAADRLAARLLG